MDEFDARIRSHIEMVLEEVCDRLPHDEVRKYVAERLIDAARSGKTCRDDLLPIALRALLKVTNPTKNKPNRGS